MGSPKPVLVFFACVKCSLLYYRTERGVSLKQSALCLSFLRNALHSL